MLFRALIARMGVVPWRIGALGVALAHCGGVGDDPPRASSQAIIGGSVADAADSPVLLLLGPEGGCSAVLVAPTLAMTARHCVASTTPGSFSCTAAGEVVNTGNGAGQIGTDNVAATLTFFAAASANAGASGTPDAVGVRIISTQTPTACRDDLAFVVLDRTIPGLVPAPIRITRTTSVGETVSVWGYGLTDHLAPMALRVADGVQIAGVGPDVALTSTQVAPVRAVRVGPVTCQGDSGGPVVSAATGAVIAIVSLGSQAGANGPYCTSNELADTTGPRLAAYHDWIATVFQEAGASPLTDDPTDDAATDATATVETSVLQGESSTPDDALAVNEALAVTDASVANDAPAPDDAFAGDDPFAGDSGLGGALAAESQWRTGESCATAGGS
ncbi:MAG TPA: trypsin-like serine protease, partial [Polyangiaceae bacterium]|nr:trypsin-like serine protease [Polyangiaceae bacterium]